MSKGDRLRYGAIEIAGVAGERNDILTTKFHTPHDKEVGSNIQREKGRGKKKMLSMTL